MMDFLRRLAPARQAAATRAVPLLAPRFAAAPAGLAAAAPADGLADSATPPGGRHDAKRMPPSRAVPAGDDARLPVASTAVAPAGTVSAATLSDARLEMPTRPPSDGSARTSARSLEPRDDDMPRPFAAAPWPARRPAAPARTRAQPAHAAISPPTSIARGADVAAARPAGLAAPLSAAALAARQPTRSEEPPVIHVTIDRIDVRAAPASTRAASAARARHHTPSVSLADYLRAGDKPPGGSTG